MNTVINPVSNAAPNTVPIEIRSIKNPKCDWEICLVSTGISANGTKA